MTMFALLGGVYYLSVLYDAPSRNPAVSCLVCVCVGGEACLPTNWCYIMAGGASLSVLLHATSWRQERPGDKLTLHSQLHCSSAVELVLRSTPSHLWQAYYKHVR